MDLKTYSFPELTGLDLVFSTVKTDPLLLDEAEKRGFGSFSNPYRRLFSTLFFEGGEVEFKEGIEKEFKEKAWRYCRALMTSFEPKHEDKTAVCAMLMSELLVLPKQ